MLILIQANHIKAIKELTTELILVKKLRNKKLKTLMKLEEMQNLRKRKEDKNAENVKNVNMLKEKLLRIRKSKKDVLLMSKKQGEHLKLRKLEKKKKDWNEQD